MARSKDVKCPSCGFVIPDAAGEGFWTLRATLPEEVRALWEETQEAVRAEMRGLGIRLHASPRIESGQILEVLCASYIAGARDHARAFRELREEGTDA